MNQQEYNLALLEWSEGLREHPGPQPSTGDDATLQHEWTVVQQSTRNVWELRCGSQLITTSTHYSMLQLVADAHNAAIATVNNQLDDAGSHNEAADRELRELRRQLAKLKEVK